MNGKSGDKSSLEQKVGSKKEQDEKGIYFKAPPEVPDARKGVMDIVKENGLAKAPDEAYPLDSERMKKIEEQKLVDELREKVGSTRHEYANEIRNRISRWKIKKSEADRRRGLPADFDSAEGMDPASRAIHDIASMDSGYSPEKTKQRAFRAFLLKAADRDGIYSPGKREKAVDFSRDWLINRPKALLDYLNRPYQKRLNKETYKSLKKGDKVVIDLREHGHRHARETFSGKGYKYISPLGEDLDGLSYHAGQDEKEASEAIYKIAKKVYEKTGVKPVVKGHQKAAASLLNSLAESDLAKFTRPFVVSAGERKYQDEKASGYINIFGTGGNDRISYREGGANYLIPRKTALDISLGGNDVLAEIISEHSDNSYHADKRRDKEKQKKAA